MVEDIEELRLQALRNYHVLDTGPENEFDSITRLASYICKTPISLINFVDEHRQWFKSSFGLSLQQTECEISFCRHTILNDEIFEIEDTANDARFADSPLVGNDPKIRFYAGVPLISPEGYRIGTLCVIDTKPNKLGIEQKDALKILAGEVISHLEVAKKNRQLQETLIDYQKIYTMFKSSGELQGILDETGKFELINPAVSNILGFSTDQVIGRSMWEFCHPEDIARFYSQLTESLKSGKKNFNLEVRVIANNGDIKTIGWAIAVQARKWYVNGRDITYQKQVVADLEQLSLVASKIESGVIISDTDNKVIWVNPAFEKITGFNINDLHGQQLGDVLKGEETDENIISEARNWIKNKESFTVELLAYRKDGKAIWLSITNTLVLNTVGNVDKEIEIITDITAKKEAEQQLDILSIAASKSSSGIVVRTNSGEILWMNEALESILGYSLKELRGKTFGEILLGEDTDISVLKIAQEAVLEKRPYEIEIKIYKKNRQAIWVFISNNPIFNSDGEIERQVGIMVDITERKKAEEELTLLSLVASKTVNGVVISDAQGKVKWVNHSFQTLTGYNLDDVNGSRIGDVLVGEGTDLKELEYARALASNRQPFNVELLNYKKDGSPIWVSVSNTPIFNKDGSVEQEIEIINDISERKKVEQNLRKTREDALQ